MIQIWLELLLNQKKQPRRQGQIFFIFKNWAKLKSYILQEFNCKVICLKVHRYYSILLLARNKSRKFKELKNESEIKPQLYIRLDSQKHRNMKVKRFRIEVIWNSLNPAFFSSNFRLLQTSVFIIWSIEVLVSMRVHLRECTTYVIASQTI